MRQIWNEKWQKLRDFADSLPERIENPYSYGGNGDRDKVRMDAESVNNINGLIYELGAEIEALLEGKEAER